MEYYAELDKNNYVLRVICVSDKHCYDENNSFDENLGSKWCSNELGGRWIRTSYTGEFRKNYAGIGDYYDEKRDAFITELSYEGWIFDEEKCQWVPPIPKPNIVHCVWDQNLGKWIDLDNQ